MQRGNNQTPRGRGRGRGRGSDDTNRGHVRGAPRGRGGYGRGHTNPRSILQGFGLGADDSSSRGGRGTWSRGRRGRGGPQIHPNAWTPHRGRRGFLRGIGFDVPNTERPAPNFISGNDPGRIKIDLRNRPLLRPVIFVRSATVLFENKDEIFQPEIVENEMDDTPTADRVESLFAGVPIPAFEREPEATDSGARPRFTDYSVPADFEDDDDDIPTLDFGFSEAELITIPPRPSHPQQKSRLNQLLDNLAQTSLASDNEKTTADFALEASGPPTTQDDMAAPAPLFHFLLPKGGTDDSQTTVMTSSMIEVPEAKPSITGAPILTSLPDTSTPLSSTLQPDKVDLSTEEPAFTFDFDTSRINGEPDILYHSYPNVVGRPSQRTITHDDNDVIVFGRKEVTSVPKAVGEISKAPARIPQDPTFTDTEGEVHAGEPNVPHYPRPNLVDEPAQRAITGDDNDVVVFTRREVTSVHEATSERSVIRTGQDLPGKPEDLKSSTENMPFIIDTEGTTHADEEPSILYHSQSHVMGEPTRSVTTDDVDEVIVFTHKKKGSERVGNGPVVPPTISFADCKSEFSEKCHPEIPGVKASRRARRGGRRARSKRVKGSQHCEGMPRLDDSDIDWGSDGPPQKASLTTQENEVDDHGMEIDLDMEGSAYGQLIAGLLHPETISIDDLIAQEKIREEDEESDDTRGSGGEDDSEEEDTSAAHDDEISSSEIDAAIRAEEMQLEGDSDESESEDSEGSEDNRSDGRIEDISNSYLDFPRGKSRGGRKVTFKAVENDGSDEVEIEDMIAKRNGDLAQGRKRKKKEGAYVSDELRELWQRSREKKAQYKKDREEARKMGLLLPSRKSGKRKDKFGNRVHDNGEGGKAAFIKARPSVNLSAIADQIRAFVEDLGIETIELPPMDKGIRKKVHEIATRFRLKSRSRGAEGERYITLIRTSRTSIKGSHRKLFRKTSEGPPKGRLLQRDGDIVGSRAEPIGESNVGFRLLSRMGWSKGERIGTSGGLADPLRAVIKNSKLGLGAVTYGQS